MEIEYTELEMNAFKELLKDNKALSFEDLKCAYIKNRSFLRFTSSFEGEITKINSIKKWIFLNQVEIDINSIDNLDGLEELPNLEKLFVRNVDNSKLNAIGKCKSLKVLEINGDINDISFLENLNNLEDLGLQDNRNLIDISSLANMKKLKELNLIGTKVSDISILNNLESLQKVILNDTNVCDVSALSQLKNLKSIFLANTKVKDISMLANLPNLELLNVYDTEVEDVSEFIKKGKLNVLGIEKKKIPKIEKKDVQKELAKLIEKISNAKIQLNDVADESEIASFENENNIEFPENYRSFIKQIGNGLVMFDEEGNEQVSFKPLSECEFDKKGISKNFKYKDAWIWEEDENATDRKVNNALTNGSICLADMGCGIEYHLIINGPSRGQVWMFTGEGVVPFDTCSDFLDWINEIIEGKIE